jgi:CHAT domain-containing protein
MMFADKWKHLVLPLCSALLIVPVADARVPERPDTIALGRNPAGEPCFAQRDWHDPAVPDPFNRSYAITCRSVSASRPVGGVRIVPATPEATKPIEATLDCGPAIDVTIADRPARARRCYDQRLSASTVRFDIPVGDSVVIGDATAALAGQGEEAVAILSGARKPSPDAMRTAAPTVDIAKLGPEVAGPTVPTETAAFDPSRALADGVALNHKGLHVEASRELNDALSRLPASVDPAVHAELLMEAGLADSNIRFEDVADQHFADADALMAANPSAHTPFLQRKFDAYRALDLINQHRFKDAVALLDRLAQAQVPDNQPLQDPATLRLLNQPRFNATDAANAIAAPDTADLSQLVLDVQANWARSIALMAMGDDTGASQAIEQAARAYRPLTTEHIDRTQVLWLGARIDRQRARLLARRGQTGPALASFDAALDDLRRGAVASAGTGKEPSIAQAELERATIYAQGNAPQAAVREAYGNAIDAILASGSDTLTGSNGLEAYLDLLVAEAAKQPQADTYDRYFRAVQTTGEPAAARQVNQLQSVVSADPAIATLIRQRGELDREVTRLRYAIAAHGSADAAAAGKGDAGATKGASDGDLNAARANAEARLADVNAKLAANPRYNTVDDSPATIDQLRAALKPGEAYLKLTTLNRRIYALVVTPARSYAYAVAPNAAAKKAVMELADGVRASIDGQLDIGKLVPFDDARAYALFRLIAGPAEGELMNARALVVDPSGPLERLPAAVLVTRYDKKAAALRSDPFDFSQTSFLASTATISTALSPRSFLTARALPPSRATRPFLGLGEHQPSAILGTAGMVRVGYGCMVDAGKLSALSAQFKPIDKSELTIAADALGANDAPQIVDAAFSDTAVEARDDLSQYAVVHFATHGLEEGQWGCPSSPPALVTSFGDANSDGLLSFSEIAGLHLDANLVFLSACDTAAGVKDEALARQSGQEEVGSTLDGLVRAFLTANARAVMATYWQVSAEKEGQEFIRTFYSSGRTKAIGAALQDAQRELMRQPAYSHPFYWAPYFVVGDSSKEMLAGVPTVPLPQVRMSAR